METDALSALGNSASGEELDVAPDAGHRFFFAPRGAPLLIRRHRGDAMVPTRNRLGVTLRVDCNTSIEQGRVVVRLGSRA